MKCSIILTGKNDNYGGHFDERLILTTKYNAKKLTKLGVDVEIIFVEWNPLEDKPLLSEKLSKAFDDIKCYVVDNETHNKFRGEFEYMTFLEFFAKNIGIRRATGDILICSNADVFYNDNVFKFIAKSKFQDNVIYRAERKDIRFHKLKGLSDDLFLQATFRTNPVGGPPYVDASGDFTMATKKTFESIGGYDENMRFVKIHKDSRILFSAMEKEMSFLLIGDIFHIDHEGSAVGTTGDLSNYRETNGPYQWMYFKGLPYNNSEFWGMNNNSTETKLQDKIFKLNFLENFQMNSYNFRDEDFTFKNKTKKQIEKYIEFAKNYHAALMKLWR